MGGLGIKQCENSETNMGTHVFMQASDFIINYLNKNKFLLPYLHLNISKNVLFICFGETSFLSYKVGKLILFSPVSFFNFILYK